MPIPPSRPSLGFGPCCDCPAFEPVVFKSGEGANRKNYVMVKPGVIYKSFNLKDMMIWSGYLDDQTKDVINAATGRNGQKIDKVENHIIQGIYTPFELKKYTVLYLDLRLGGFYVTGAVITTGDGGDKLEKVPWSGFPEPFIFKQKDFKFKPNGKSDYSKFQNRLFNPKQLSAIVPIGYMTTDQKQNGTFVDLTPPGSTSENADPDNFQIFVRTLCGNLIMNRFSYQGVSVTYPIISPFEPYLWWSSSSSSS